MAQPLTGGNTAVNKLWHIAWNEFNYHVRQASFFVALALMVVLVLLLNWLPGGTPSNISLDLSSFTAVQETLALGESLSASETIGYVDLAELVTPDIAADPDFKNLIPYPNEATAEAALRAGDIRHYYVIGEDYVNSGRVRHYSSVAARLTMADSNIEQLVRQSMREKTYADSPDIPSPLEIVWQDQPNPMLSRLPTELNGGILFTAVAILGIFAYLVNISGALLLDALMRESSARIMEMMVTTTTPAQFLGGKVLGLTLVAAIQLSISLLTGVFVYSPAPGTTGFVGITPGLVLLITAFLGLGYLAYSGVVMMMTMLFPNIGTSLQLQFFLRMLILSPAVGLFFILPDPDSWVSVVLTINPLSSALLMPLRMLLTAVAPTQILLSLFFLLVWSFAIFWLSTRLFRAQTLLTGHRPAVGLIWQALWS
ncbi:MAG: ABC transporter permease [Anaerolineales bacterium]|nr:ABC transporter permease [Anaerolineales bacterium]